MKKRILSALLVLALVAALLPGLPVLALDEPLTPPADIQDGVTLHCWNWSFANIEARMADIAAMGYTAIQTSPIQQAKQPTANFPSNDWWVFYQPASFSIDDSGNSALGTKAEFQSMCETAHQYGIKVIVDVVANNMGNADTGTGISTAVIEELRKDPDCWHDVTKNTNNYSSRLEVTQYCMAGLPDLNTANPKVQQFVLNYLKECIDAGADGFRFDAVKHIETPDDGDLASDFWPTVIDGAEDYAESSRGIDLYCYGELLDSPGGSLSHNAYTEYMSITDNGWSNNVLANVIGKGSALSPSYYKGEAEDLVLWAESHDTFADGSTADASEESINKAWALIAARADAMSLYLARPANMSQYLGAGSLTGWARPEVAAVNKFHNAFVGQSEYVGNEAGIASVVRGNSGAVLVNTKGNSTDVNISIQNLATGTYTDMLTGNIFTVDLGTITGTIGASGIAVLMDADVCAHATHDAEGLCEACRVLVGHEYDENNTCACGDVKVGDRTIYFINSGRFDTVNFYAWYDPVNIFTDAWPGNAMTLVEGNLYSCTVPADVPNIIFNDGASLQTEDLTVPADKDQFDFMTRKWSVYSETSGSSCPHTSHNIDGICAECGGEVGHLYGDNGLCDCGATDPSIRIVYFTNSANWGTVNFYSWYDGGGEITAAWPGDAMTKVEDNIYSCIVPADAKNIIFNDGGSKQTDNLTLSADKNMFTFSSKQWSTYTPEPEPTEPPATDAPTEVPTDATGEPKPAEPANPTGVILVWVAVGIAILAIADALIWRKKHK